MSSLAERLREALAEPVSAIAEIAAADLPTPLKPAAVLIAITDRPQPGVLLTLRHSGLRAHAGQVAFPGGRVDEADAGIVAAALREAEEEIGLPRSIPQVVGFGGPMITATGYNITPVVAVVPPDLPLVPNAAEVDLVFEPPLAFLIDRANHMSRTVIWQGRERSYIEMFWSEQRIWGATAAMLNSLAERLERVVA